MNPHVLVLGGDYLAVRIAQGLVTTATVTLVDDKVPMQLAGIKVIRGNPGDELLLRELLPQVQVIINGVSGNPEKIVKCGQGLYGLLSQLKNTAQRIQISSFAAYGTATGVVTEAHELLGDVDAYSAARAVVDRLALDHAAVCLRPGIIYGPSSVRWSQQIGKLLLAKRLGDLGAAGDGHCNLVFIDDVVSVVAGIVQNQLRGPAAYNLVATRGVTWNDYFLAYARALGAVPIRRITRRRLQLETRIAAPALRIAGIVCNEHRLSFIRLAPFISPSMLRLFSQDIELDAGLADNTLQPSWTPLERGVAAAAQWLAGR